jgi:hypothetical protein
VIVLPADPAPRNVAPQLLDFGTILRPGTGAPAVRINRNGTRWQAQFTMPAMTTLTARLFQARLARAKNEGLRMPWPLLGVPQGAPGSVVVNGTGAAGTNLPVRGLSRGYRVLEGYWLNVTDADGQIYLHQAAARADAASDGTATLAVWPPLRAVLADGSMVQLARPEIMGLVTSDVNWELPVNRVISGLTFTVEESA